MASSSTHVARCAVPMPSPSYVYHACYPGIGCRHPPTSGSASSSRLPAFSNREVSPICLRSPIWLRYPLERYRTSRHLDGTSTFRTGGSVAGSTASTSTASLSQSLKQLDDEQLQALAEEWGYDQLGKPLPEGLTLNVLGHSIPDELLRVDVKRLLLGVLAPLALMAAGYAWMWYMHTIIPGWQQTICWLLIGTGYFGLFTVAHDAARVSLLPNNQQLESLIGTLIMAPSLYSFEAWRVMLMIHYNQTNMLGEDDAGWQPLTKQRLAEMSSLERKWAQLTTTTPLKLLGSICHWISSFGNFDLKRYYAPMRVAMIGSWSVPFWFMGLVWPAIIASGGLPAWFDCWLMPWLVFHFWLSLLTLLQHTAPHVAFEEEGPQYDAAQAVVNGTVTVRLPRWLEFVLNNANYHLPQHLRGGVPFYNARAATEAATRKLGPFLTQARLNGRLLRNLIERWQVYDEEKRTYVTFQQALKEIDAEGPQSQADGPALQAS